MASQIKIHLDVQEGLTEQKNEKEIVNVIIYLHKIN